MNAIVLIKCLKEQHSISLQYEETIINIWHKVLVQHTTTNKKVFYLIFEVVRHFYYHVKFQKRF